MRFLMLNWRDPKNPEAGGAEQVTMAYWAELVRRGHEAWWFAQDFEGAIREDVVEGVRIVRQGGRFSSRPKAWKWYRSQPPFDLVVDQFHGIPWLAPWWAGTRCMAYLHEVLGPIWDSFYPWPWNWIGRFQERWCYRLYRRVPFWTGCESTRRFLQHWGVRQVHVVSYGVATMPLDPLPEKELTPPLRLVMVSRLAPNKRLDHGILALEQLRQNHIEAHLHIVGTGVEKDKLHRLVRNRGLTAHCTFTGYLSEEKKLKILADSHFLLHASLREGWGLNVVEANAMGTPAIVYPVPGLVDSTRHMETGIITENDSPDTFTTTILRLLQDPTLYARLRHQAWHHARSMHWSNILPKACSWLEDYAATHFRSPSDPIN